MKRLIKASVISLLSVALAAGLALAKEKNKKKDPEEIGNRDVGRGVNFYSLEKEINIGKQYMFPLLSPTYTRPLAMAGEHVILPISL